MKNLKSLISQYQCPGCVSGPDTDTCPEYTEGRTGCAKHVAGTIKPYVGTIFLGLPRGFNRLGPATAKTFEIHNTWAEYLSFLESKSASTKFTIPVWMYLDDSGNTIIRSYCPRINHGCTILIAEDCRHLIQATCVEITSGDVEDMD